MDTICAESQAAGTQQFSPEYVSRMVRGLALLFGSSGMDDIYKQLMSAFVRDLRRALQSGCSSAQITDAFLTAFSDNSDSTHYLCAAIDAAVDFRYFSTTATGYNLRLLRIYFEALAGDESRTVMIYSDRFIPCGVSLRLGHAEQAIRANPCRHTLDSQLLDEALFYSDLEPESETDDESTEILHDMKREHDPAVVRAAMKSGAAKNIYQAVAHAQLTREYLVVTLARKATEWRVQDGKVGRGGIVVFPPVDITRPASIDRIAVAGWSNELRNPERWVPGCIALNEDGKLWEAKGGDEWYGADAWVSMWVAR
jgi:hypothetical protein